MAEKSKNPETSAAKKAPKAGAPKTKAAAAADKPERAAKDTAAAKKSAAAQPPAGDPPAPRKRTSKAAAAAEPAAAFAPIEAAFTAPVLSEERRRGLIAERAYLRAEARGFVGGGEVDDWLAAEAEVEAELRNLQ